MKIPGFHIEVLASESMGISKLLVGFPDSHLFVKVDRLLGKVLLLDTG